MPISIACTCGKAEEVPDSFAGKHVRCRTCGARIKIGLAAAESNQVPESGSALNYSRPNSATVVISRERMMAGRICFGWGAIKLLLCTCVGLSFLTTLGRLVSHRAMGAAGGVTAVYGVILAVIMAWGLAYIFGGINIRRGGTVSVIVCLVLATIQLLFAGLATLLYLMVALTQEPLMFVAVVICLLAGAALGQLYYYLIMILRQPRAAV
ncbi:MAG TPA: hypothetical protein VHM90_15425 [Phycisphaerae bacterium]|nr:hypothetical protein [Phycisphaerae bacterium]